jgi:hypothetical protein
MSSYESLSKATHGRVTYDSLTRKLNPYRTNSEKRWKDG